MKKSVLVCLIAFLMAGCDVQPQDNSQKLKDSTKRTSTKPSAVRISTYDVKSSRDYYIEKYEIDGHEYLLFAGRLASSPAAVHSASCPCNQAKSFSTLDKQ